MSEKPLLFDLTGRGAIALAGKDRASFLHGLITNDVKSLKPGDGCYAAFLTPKGKMLADLTVLCAEDEILVDCDPELADKLDGLLRKYLVFNEVTIENRTNETAVLHLTEGADGNAVEDLLKKAIGLGKGATLPETPHAHVTIEFFIEEGFSSAVPVRVVLEARSGRAGFDLRFSRRNLSSVLSVFEAKGLSPSPLSFLDDARIEAGIPRWGFELDETVLPDEAGFRERGAISYTKGCYIGQETVARIKTYGHVNRTLVRLTLAGAAPPRGSDVFFEGEKAGSVTSSVSASGARSVALAYVRRERATPGTRLTVRTASGDLPAEIAASPAD